MEAHPKIQFAFLQYSCFPKTSPTTKMHPANYPDIHLSSFHEVTKNYKNAKVNRLKKFLIAAEDVKNNKSDCIVMDALPAKELVKSNPELKILDGVLFQDKYGMAVKKGNQELLNTINQVLERLISEGKIEEYMIQFSE